MAKIFDNTLTSSTGAQLHVQICKTKKPAKAIIQINHGLTEHSGRYAEFMKYLAKHGFHSIAHDHRGHGLTKAEQLPIGQFSKRDGARKVIKDVRFVHDYIAHEYPNLPVIGFGHSMGGLIIANFAIQNPNKLTGLAIWNSNFQASRLAVIAKIILFLEAFFKGSDVPSTFMSQITFERWGKSIKDGNSNHAWLTHDQEMIEKIASDELGGWQPSVSMWSDIMDLTARAAQPNALQNLPKDLPINLVAGGQDPATDFGKAIDWFVNELRENGCTNINYQTYRSFRHETLNEIDRLQAMDDFISWANNVVKK